MRVFAFADEACSYIDGQIAAMKRNGLHGLEARNIDTVNVSEITLEKALEVRRKMEDNGLVTWSIGSPIGKIDIVKDNFDAHLDVFKHTLEVASVLGATNIRLFSFYIPENTDPAECRNEVIERLGRFCELAAGCGIDLCHENEKGIYGDTAERCLDLFKALPQLKGIFDPANFVQSGVDTWRAWGLLAPYIKYLHIKDSLPDGSVVPAGAGIGHIDTILSAFRSGGGDVLTIEPHLAVFDGLSGLEREGEESLIGKYTYRDNDEAFDAACTALRNMADWSVE